MNIATSGFRNLQVIIGRCGVAYPNHHSRASGLELRAWGSTFEVQVPPPPSSSRHRSQKSHQIPFPCSDVRLDLATLPSATVSQVCELFVPSLYHTSRSFLPFSPRRPPMGVRVTDDDGVERPSESNRIQSNRKMLAGDRFSPETDSVTDSDRSPSEREPCLQSFRGKARIKVRQIGIARRSWSVDSRSVKLSRSGWLLRLKVPCPLFCVPQEMGNGRHLLQVRVMWSLRGHGRASFGSHIASDC